ncbi:MAG TPA: nuclear transport factor 2 family protein [Frankiaceae bacterium]|jgi:ketosteroid isomerase-like protein|nr:nuclear transport factor 2 family protein [Frankiaceae bacterium]
MTTNWNSGTSIPATQLPAAITAYLIAHQSRDLDAAMPHYTADATVTDEGHTYSDPAAIREWLATSASQYTYTIELTAAREIDDSHYVAAHHLEGNFPGGVADLQYKFTLRSGLIQRLIIEP